MPRPPCAPPSEPEETSDRIKSHPFHATRAAINKTPKTRACPTRAASWAKAPSSRCRWSTASAGVPCHLDEYLAAGGRALAPLAGVEPEALVAVESSACAAAAAPAPDRVKWRTIVANASSSWPRRSSSTRPRATRDLQGPHDPAPRPLLRARGGAGRPRAVGAGDVVVALKAREPSASGSSGRSTRWQGRPARRRRGLGGGGPHEYLFGEETALLEVVGGRAPLPRIAPPYRRGVVEVVEDDDDVASGSGLSATSRWPGPTTRRWRRRPRRQRRDAGQRGPHHRRGAAWFREMGTEASPGTVVCTVTGDVVRPGVGEIPLGTTVREAIDAVAGGPTPSTR